MDDSAPATQPPSVVSQQASVVTTSPTPIAAGASDPAASPRPAKRATPEQGQGAPPASATVDDQIAALTAVIASEQTASAALREQVSTLTGMLGQLLPTLQQVPAAAESMQSAANALSSPEAGPRGAVETKSNPTAKSIELIDKALSSSTNRLRAITTAAHAAENANKALAGMDPAKLNEPLPSCLPSELRAKPLTLTRGGSLAASEFADLQAKLVEKQRCFIFDQCTLYAEAKERVVKLCEAEQTKDEEVLQQQLRDLFTDTRVPENEAQQEVTTACEIYQARKAKLVRDLETTRRAGELERAAKSAELERKKLEKAQKAEANLATVHAVARHVVREEIALNDEAKSNGGAASQEHSQDMEEEDGGDEAASEDQIEQFEKEAAIEQKILRTRAGANGAQSRTAKGKNGAKNGQPPGKKTSPSGASDKKAPGKAAQGSGSRTGSKKGGGRGGR